LNGSGPWIQTVMTSILGFERHDGNDYGDPRVKWPRPRTQLHCWLSILLETEFPHHNENANANVLKLPCLQTDEVT